MHCSLCGLYPKWLSFDGVSLALSKDKVRWDTAETIFPKDGSTQVLAEHVIKQKERMLLSDSCTRELLQNFCTAKPTPMNCDEFGALQEALTTQCPPLHTLLQELYDAEKQCTAPLPVYNYSFPGNWKQFLYMVSSTTSAALILRPKVVPPVLHLIEHKIYTPDMHEILATSVPQLAHALCFLPQSKVPQSVADLLLALVDKVKLTHPKLTFVPTAPTPVVQMPTSITNTSKPQPQDMPQQTWLNHLKTVVKQVDQSHIPLTTGFNHTMLHEKYTVLPEADSTLSGVYYPTWPKIHSLPRFAGIDPAPTTKTTEWSDPQASTTEAELFCKKVETNNYESRKHTAGMFVVSCLHGICYGYHNMLQPEGRKDFTKVLYERMPSEVLDGGLFALYDFACQAAEYMYNRCPELVHGVEFKLDRFHGVSHKCAGVFKLHEFAVYQQLVSTGAEILNDFLQLMHGQTPFMKQETKAIVLNGVVGIRNYLINDELERIITMYANK